VGFNPFRKQARRGSDIVIVVAAFAIVAALLLWAVLPR
jgi:predicted amidohydrolase